MSAVDAHVGGQLFSGVIGPEGMLRNKTRILVTNELSFLRHSDLILIMNEGKIEHEGSYVELMHQGALEQLLAECEKEEQEEKKKRMEEEEEAEFSHDEGGFDDSDIEYNDDIVAESPLDHILGSSHMSTVSGIVARRRVSTSTVIKKTRKRTLTMKSPGPQSAMTSEVSSGQLTNSEKVETGRVS